MVEILIKNREVSLLQTVVYNGKNT